MRSSPGRWCHVLMTSENFYEILNITMIMNSCSVLFWLSLLFSSKFQCLYSSENIEKNNKIVHKTEMWHLRARWRRVWTSPPTFQSVFTSSFFFRLTRFSRTLLLHVARETTFAIVVCQYTFYLILLTNIFWVILCHLSPSYALASAILRVIFCLKVLSYFPDFN